MLNFIKTFRADEDGAVTVDWVVLTAAMVAFGAGIALSLSTAATAPAEGIGSELTSYDPTP